jgi:hypothetical protein
MTIKPTPENNEEDRVLYEKLLRWYSESTITTSEDDANEITRIVRELGWIPPTEIHEKTVKLNIELYDLQQEADQWKSVADKQDATIVKLQEELADATKPTSYKLGGGYVYIGGPAGAATTTGSLKGLAGSYTTGPMTFTTTPKNADLIVGGMISGVSISESKGNVPLPPAAPDIAAYIASKE